MNRGARPLDAARGLDIGGEEAAIAIERAVELDGEAGAIVLHQRQLFLGVAAGAVLPGAALDRRFEQIEGRADPL